jgi:hypothetical protein
MSKTIKSVNNLPLKEGDRVHIIGKVPDDSCVYYSMEMEDLLENNDNKIYKVVKFGKQTIYVSGWYWDPRNIYKIVEQDDLPKEQEAVLFDEKNLVT